MWSMPDAAPSVLHFADASRRLQISSWRPFVPVGNGAHGKVRSGAVAPVYAALCSHRPSRFSAHQTEHRKKDVNVKSTLEVRFATKTRCAAVMDANSSMQLDWEVASLSDLLRQTSEVWATSLVEGQPAARSVRECHADKGFPPPSCEVLTWMSATGQTGWGAGCPQDMRHEPKSRCLARRARRNKGLEGTHCPEACVCSGFLRRTVA